MDYRIAANYISPMDYETSPVLDLSMKKERRESVMSEDSSIDQGLDFGESKKDTSSAKTYKKKLLTRYCKFSYILLSVLTFLFSVLFLIQIFFSRKKLHVWTLNGKIK